MSQASDPVNHPQHYGAVPGIECIDVVEHFSFNRGNAIKYLWRAGAKGDPIEDLRKAIWYIEREIVGLEAASPSPPTAPSDGEPVPPTRPSPTAPGY